MFSKSRSQLNGVRHVIFSFLTIEECVKKISVLNKQIRNELKSENDQYNFRIFKLDFANGVKIVDFAHMNYSI